MSKFIHIINNHYIEQCRTLTKIPNVIIPEINEKIPLKYPSIDTSDKKYNNFSEDYQNNMPSLFYFLDGAVTLNLQAKIHLSVVNML